MKPVVLSSIESDEGNRCIDFFERPDGTYGFEEYRRDPESASGWFVTGQYATEIYLSLEITVRAASEHVIWFSRKRVTARVSF